MNPLVMLINQNLASVQVLSTMTSELWKIPITNSPNHTQTSRAVPLAVDIIHV